MTADGKTNEDRLSRAAASARKRIKEAGSDKLLGLFDYLVSKSIAGEVPSEQQVASEAFPEGSASGGGQTPNVRVSIHRLRKLVAASGKADGRDEIEIPVGSYCVRLVERPKEGRTSRPSNSLARIRSAFAMSRRTAIATSAVAVLALAALFLVLVNRSVEPLSGTVVWQSFDQSGHPVIIVYGDYYMFTETDDGGSVNESEPTLVWDRSVRTREDLIVYQMLEAASADKAVDLDQHFVSAATIEAVSLVRSALARLPSSRYAGARIVAASQMSPEMLRDADIIYVGQFSGMPVLLKDPLARASSLELSAELDSLNEAGGTKRYQSDARVLTDDRIARRDYAYLAELPGPAGNRLLMIVGLGEAGLREAAELMGDAGQLQAISSSPNKLEHGFEGLYRVRTIGNVNVNATLVVDRPLKTEDIWDESGNVPAYRPIAPAQPVDRE